MSDPLGVDMAVPGDAGPRPGERSRPGTDAGPRSPATALVPTLDDESREWLVGLSSVGDARSRAVEALFDLLHAGARVEARRRRPALPASVADELDDLARQAAADAVVAILRKLPDYRGASRFTTWAYKFVVFELSSALRREAWRGRSIRIEDGAWDRLVDTAAWDPVGQAQGRELLLAIRRAVSACLSARQRDVLMAVAVGNVPVDVVAERQGSSRGAIYKMLHDARANLRQALDREGWQVDGPERSRG